MIALDTNLLIYAHRTDAVHHQRAKELINLVSGYSSGWGVSLPGIAEFWNNVTHPKYPGGPSSTAKASGFLNFLRQELSMQIFLPHNGFSDLLIKTAHKRKITAVHIFDLQIALIAKGNGASEIWTHDHKFIGLPGLKVVNPL
jgi:predicted nucleic acid-binding protein